MRYLLLLLCIAELLFITWFRNVAGPLITPVLFLGSSIGIGFLFLRISQRNAEVPAATLKLHPNLIRALQFIPLLALSYLVFKTMKTIWWWQTTIDSGVDKSDIIPQIAALVQRHLRGEQPYYPIQFTGYQLYPTYLPMQWLPYIPVEILHKDYRWVPTIGLWLASVWFFVKNTFHKQDDAPLLWKLLLPVWPLIAWYAMIMYDNDLFKLTVESLIAAYYLFTATSISGKRVLPLAIGVAVCLLSRYSIIFWVPLCVGCYYLAGQRKQALVIVGTALVFFIVVYWLPFLRKDGMIFLNGYHYHTDAAYNQWLYDRDVLQSKFYLANGFGFTAWAIRFIPGDLRHVLGVYQKVHLVMCFITIAGLLYLYWKKRAVYSLQAFLLFSFKVYLAVFYAFIQIPYRYLYIVPVIVSSVLLANAFNKRWLAEKGAAV